MQVPQIAPNDCPPPPPWWHGPLVTLGFVLALLAAIAFVTSCAEYPLAISVNSDKGTVSFSRRGIEITVEK